MGRLTSDPSVRYTPGANSMCIARYTLAVNRRVQQEGQPTADFINCVAFGKLAEHCEKYYRQGTKVTVCGRVQTGSYTNKEGQKVYTTEVVIEEQEFAESKAKTEQDAVARNTSPEAQQRALNSNNDGFMNIPDGIDEELPFN